MEPNTTTKTRKWGLIFLLGLILAAFSFYYLSSSEKNYDTEISVTEHDSIKVTLAGKTLNTFVSDTSITRSQGLSVFESLGEDEAMIFIFDELDDYAFWMKDMSFSIDIFWLDENKEIVFIKEDARPEDYPSSYQPTSKALYVLETQTGFAAKHNIEIGDSVDFSLE